MFSRVTAKYIYVHFSLFFIFFFFLYGNDENLFDLCKDRVGHSKCVAILILRTNYNTTLGDDRMTAQATD